MQRALVLGAGGFIGHHLVRALKDDGFWVRGVDLKEPAFAASDADDFVLGDLRRTSLVEQLFGETYDEVYQLAADMGGAGFVFTGAHDADIMHNSAMINLNVAQAAVGQAGALFYASSACIYPERNQIDPDNPQCREDSAYPAAPDSEYGWEKLFSERLYLAFYRNYDLPVRIARYHNIYGPEGTWRGGREKAPAALCRKVAEAPESGEVEMWGDGRQTRSFLYIDDCIDATRRLLRSDFAGPVNIGSEEMVSIRTLLDMIIELSGKRIEVVSVPGPQGVRGRNSDNALIQRQLDWTPNVSLTEGIAATYRWIAAQVRATAG